MFGDYNYTPSLKLVLLVVAILLVAGALLGYFGVPEDLTMPKGTGGLELKPSEEL